MNRTLSLIIFLTVVSFVYFGLHYTVFKFFTGAFELSAKFKTYLQYLFWFSGLSFMVAMALSRNYNLYFLNYYAFIWLGIIAVAFFVSVFGVGILKFTTAAPRTVGIVALALVGLVSIVSLVRGFQYPALTEITVPIKQLPPELSGFTIIQISDLHLEEFKSNGTIPHLVKQVNEQKPDLIVLTGDLVDGRGSRSEHLTGQLKQFRARHGVIAITGNHEFFSDLRGFLRMCEEAGITVLRNQHLTVAGSLQIIGLEDDEGRRFGSQGPDLDKALAGCDVSRPMILLYHRPLLFAEAAARGVNLQLSGHTHAGQIPPMDLLVYLVYKYPCGLHQKGDSYIYTSTGTGYWGPPMRFLSRNEVTKITLTAQNTKAK